MYPGESHCLLMAVIIDSKIGAALCYVFSLVLCVIQIYLLPIVFFDHILVQGFHQYMLIFKNSQSLPAPGIRVGCPHLCQVMYNREIRLECFDVL